MAVLRSGLAAFCTLLSFSLLHYGSNPTWADSPAKPAQATPAKPGPKSTEPAAGSSDAMFKEVDATIAEVSALRGLALKKPIKRGVMNKAQIRERMMERIGEDYDPKDLAGSELMMKCMGLIPWEMDYLKTMIKLMEEQVAGFYDPASRELFLMEGQSGIGGPMILAHEVDHALGDQHFDLRKFMESVKKKGDQALARQAVAEGDGTALMLQYVFKKMGKEMNWNDPMAETLAGSMQSLPGDLAKLPLVFREQLLFPYIKGLSLVTSQLKKGGWPAVDKLYRKPPQSSEQVLHPEKYGVDAPTEVKIPVWSALSAHRKIHEDEGGELAWSIFFRNHGMSDTDGFAAAAGWDGDKVRVWGKKDSSTPPKPSDIGVIANSVWDSEKDATEFFVALKKIAPKWLGGQLQSEKDGVVVWQDKSGASAVFAVRGNQVVLASNLPADVAQNWLPQIWK